MSKPATVPEVKRYLRKADVAARYGLSERHIDRLAATGQLPKPIYISKFPMWSEAELAAAERAAVRRRAAP
jgi:predicted DNA-binding transcriptional regulator AlpA